MPPTIPQTIPTSAVLIEDRHRIDLGDIDSLADSITRLGTIEPVVLTPTATPDTYRLVAGGRRMAAILQLGLPLLYHASTYTPGAPGFVFGAELTQDQLIELELEENIRRKDMSWQERTRGIAKCHRLRVARMGLQGRSWGYRETGELFNCHYASISWAMRLDAELASPTSPLWTLTSITDAVNHLKDQAAKELEAEIAKRQMDLARQNLQTLPKAADEKPTLVSAPDSELDELFSTPTPTPTLTTPTDPALLPPDPVDVLRTRYLSNPHNDPAKFDEYLAQKADLDRLRNTIRLSERMYLGDAIQALSHFRGKFDHIITDPPYAIDVDNMDQTNYGMANVDSIRSTHDVDENLTLLEAFVSSAFDTLPDHGGYLAMWCDYSNWDYLTSLGTNIGFRVQRWPVIWLKTHQCGNSCARVNFTKTTEPCIIMAKGQPALNIVGPVGHVICPHDEYKTFMKHPFVKPFLAWKHLIDSISLRAQTIFDPFGGEGSGSLSIIRCERQFLYSEKDPVHSNRAIEHLQNHYLRINPNAKFA